MKNVIRRVMAIVLGILILSQGIYANGIVTKTKLEDIKSSIYTLEEITEKVKEKLGLGEDYKLDGSRLTTDDFYLKKVWRLEFESEDKNVQVNASAETGAITSFNYWGREDNSVLKYTKEQVRNVAEKYLHENYSDLLDQITEVDNIQGMYDRYIPYFEDENHMFIYVREMNGEIFYDNNITISVSGVTGEITAFQIMWGDHCYTKNSNTISETQARAIFEKEDAIKVKYIEVKEEDENKNNILTLRPVFYFEMDGTGMLDAVSKKIYDFEDLYFYNNDNNRYYNTMSKEAADKADYGVEMIPEEGVISREKAEETILEKLSKLTNVDSFKVKYSNYSGWYRGINGKYWTVTLDSEEDDLYVYVTIDAVSGKVLRINYNKHTPSPYRFNMLDELKELLASGEMTKDDFENKMKTLYAAGEITKEQYDNRLTDKKEIEENINTEEIKIKAETMLRKMFPEINTNEFTVEVDEAKDKSTVNVKINGIRTIDNIKYYNNGFALVYNTEVSEFTAFNFDWFYDVQVERPKTMITKEAAGKIFYDTVGFDKKLVRLKDKEKEESDGLILPIKELALIYKLKPYRFSYIDTVTGNLLDYSGKEYKEDDIKVQNFNDIKGNQYEQVIKLMNKMGFIEESNNNFLPNNTLTKKDAIKWVVLTLNRQYRYIPSVYRYYNDDEELNFKDIDKEDEYYEYIERAVRMNIIENGDYFNKEKKVTLLDISRWMINGMGQKDLAEFTNIFKTTLNVSDKDKGYVGLAEYYKIIDKTSAINSNISRGKAIETLYDFISILDELN